MKFRAERDTLLESIATAGRAVGIGGGLVGMSGLHLVLKDDQLVATGSDFDLTIASRGFVDGNDDGVAVVPSRLLNEIVKALVPGAVEISTDNDEMNIRSGRAEFSVRTLPAADLPRRETSDGNNVVVASAPFAEGLRRVVRAALKDDTKAHQLTGVLAVPTEGGLRLVATDSYRLAICDLAGLGALNDDADGVLVPARALSELQRLVTDDNESVSAALGENVATFNIGATSITTRLLKGPFPDYQRLLPDSYPNAFTVSRNELVDAVKRMKVIIRDTKDSSTPVRLTFTSRSLELSVWALEIGKATDHVDGNLDGTEVMVAFNPIYLIDGLDAIKSDEVTISIIDSSKPATIKSTTDDGYQYLLMPVRV